MTSFAFILGCVPLMQATGSGTASLATMANLVVIGAGPAGSTGALTAAAFGRKVALIDQTGHLGGAGVNTGTIPNRTLRESALLISGWRARKLLGVDVSRRADAECSDFTFVGLLLLLVYLIFALTLYLRPHRAQ
jgi:hypothetical protein